MSQTINLTQEKGEESSNILNNHPSIVSVSLTPSANIRVGMKTTFTVDTQKTSVKIPTLILKLRDRQKNCSHIELTMIQQNESNDTFQGSFTFQTSGPHQCSIYMQTSTGYHSLHEKSIMVDRSKIVSLSTFPGKDVRVGTKVIFTVTAQKFEQEIKNLTLEFRDRHGKKHQRILSRIRTNTKTDTFQGSFTFQTSGPHQCSIYMQTTTGYHSLHEKSITVRRSSYWSQSCSRLPKYQFNRLKNPHKFLLMLIVIIGLFTSQSAVAAAQVEPPLEDYLVAQVLDFTNRDGSLLSLQNPKTNQLFEEIFNNLDSLSLFNTTGFIDIDDVLTEHQRTRLRFAILSCRETEVVTTTETINQTEIITVPNPTPNNTTFNSPLETNTTLNNATITTNTTDTTDNTNNIQQTIIRPITIESNFSRYINWWGSVKKSVQALCMLRLINYDISDLLPEIKNRILFEYADKGLHWNVGQTGWDETLWGIVKAFEYGLFDILPDLSLPTITRTTLKKIEKLKEDELVSEEPTKLFDINETVVWSAPIIKVHTLSTNVDSGNLFSHQLPLQRLYSIVPGCYLSDYAPFSTITFSWDTQNFDNFENITYGLETENYRNITTSSYQNVTLANGTVETVLVETTSEEWDQTNLYYSVDYQILNSKGQSIFTQQIPFNLAEEQVQVVIPLHAINIDRLDDYYVNVQAYQDVHVEEFYNISNSDGYDWNDDFEDYEDYVEYNDTLNETEEYVEEEVWMSEWVVHQVPITFDVSFEFTIPELVSVRIKNDYQDASLYLKMNTTGLDGFEGYIWNRDEYQSNLSLNHANTRHQFQPLYIFEGENLLGTKNTGYIDLILTPVVSSSESSESKSKLPTEVHFWSYEATKNYDIIKQITPLLSLFNQSLTDLPLMHQQLSMIARIASPDVIPDLINEYNLMSGFYWYYNETSLLFEHDQYDTIEMTLETWKVLDKLGLADKYLSKRHYTELLQRFMTDYYHETYDIQEKITKITIYDPDKPEDELKYLNLFIQFLTFTNRTGSEWTTIEPSRSLPESSFEYVGTALQTSVLEDPTEQIYNDAYTSLYNRLATDQIQASYSTGLLDVLEPTPTITKSIFLSEEDMYWLSEPNSLSLLDYIISFAAIFIMFALCFNTIFPAGKYHRFLALVAIIAIGIQAIGPFLINLSSDLFSEYIRLTKTLVKMLEEGIYDISSSYTSKLGFILQPKPTSSEMILEATPNTMISRPTIHTLSTIGNSTEELYQDYLRNQKIISDRQADRDFYSSDGSTQNCHSVQVPLTYFQYLQRVASTQVSLALSNAINEAESEQEKAIDKHKQREMSFKYISSTKSFIKTATLGFMGMGGMADEFFEATTTSFKSISDTAAMYQGMKNIDDTIDALNKLKYGRGISEDYIKFIDLNDKISDFSSIIPYRNIKDEILNRALKFINSRVINDGIMSRAIYRIYGNRLLNKPLFSTNIVPFSKGNVRGAFLIDEHSIDLVVTSINTDWAAIKSTILNTNEVDLILAKYEIINQYFWDILSKLDKNDAQKIIIELTKKKIKNLDNYIPLKLTLNSRNKILSLSGPLDPKEGNLVEMPWKYDVNNAFKTAQVVRGQVEQFRKLENLLASVDENGNIKLTGKYEKVKVKWDNSTNTMIAQSTDQKLLKEFLENSSGTFTPGDILIDTSWNPRTFSMLTKGSANSDNYWYNWSSFINTRTDIQSEIGGRWFDGMKAGQFQDGKTAKVDIHQRRVIVEINMNIAQMYKNELLEIAREYANSKKYKNTLSTLSARAKTETKMIKVNEFQEFWDGIRTIPNENKVLFQIQKTYNLCNIDKNLDECIAKTASEVLSDQTPSNYLVKKISSEQMEAGASIDVSLKNGNLPTVESILKDSNPLLLSKGNRVGMLIDSENEGAIQLFATMLNWFRKHNASGSPLIEYFGFEIDTIKNCKIELEWGRGISNSSVMDIFAPDIVLRDTRNNAIIGVIQTKGKSQTLGFSHSGSFIQMIELKQIEYETGVKIAFVNINLDMKTKFIEYEWLISGKKINGNLNESLGEIYIRTKNLGKNLQENSFIDPLINRNLRKRSYLGEIYNNLMQLDSTVDNEWSLYKSKILEIIEPSYQIFNQFLGKIDSTENIKGASNYIESLSNDLKNLMAKIGKTDGINSPKEFKRNWETLVAKKYAKSVIEFLLGCSSSPLALNPDLGLLWNLNNCEDETSILANITSVSLFGDAKYQNQSFSSQGYFSGDLNDASFTLLVQNGSTDKYIEWYWPSSLENINGVTFSDYKFSGKLEGGIKYTINTDEKSVYKDFQDKCAWIRGNPYHYQDYIDWDSQIVGSENYARIDLPGIEMCTGYTNLNIYDYPIINWSWHLDPYANQEENGGISIGLTDSEDDITSNDAKTLNNDHSWTNFDWNQAQLSFLLKDSSGQKKWIHVVSTPDNTPSQPIGPSGYTTYLNPIVYLKERAYDEDDNGTIDPDEYFYNFEAPLVPEELNLLDLAHKAGLTGTEILLQEIACGTGSRLDNNGSVYNSSAKSDFYISGLIFSEPEKEIHGYSQGATQVIYEAIAVDMTANHDSWEDFLAENKIIYDKRAMDLACGFNDGNNNAINNAVDWYEQALKADLHHEFKYFFTTGLVYLRDTGDTEFYTEHGYHPVRGLFIKTKEWAQNRHTMDAPVYSVKDVKNTNEILINLGSIYENGWSSELWTYAATSLQDGLNAAGYNAKLASAEEIAHFMQKDPVEGMVILLGAIPDILWDWKHPFMSLEAMSQTDYQIAVEEYSILEQYLENGGIMLSSGQYAGGWNIAFHDYDTNETTITNYNNVSNPTGYNLGIDIGDILRDRTFAEDSYVPSSASWMTSTSENYYHPHIGRYYSLGLRDIGGSTQIRKIADNGSNYADQVWWVREDAQGSSFQPSEYTGQFVNFHTATDNISTGAITTDNVDFWLEDMFEVIFGINMNSPSGMLDNASTIVSKNKQYPVEDPAGTSNQSYYWFDTFDNSNDDDNWVNLNQYTYNGMKVGQMTSTLTSKNINMVSVADYPSIYANVFGQHNPTVLSNGNYAEYADWTPVSGSVSWDRLNNNLEIENQNCHQMYYMNMHEENEQQGYITLNSGTGLTVTPETFFHMAVNPYQISSYEIAPNVVMTEEDWDDYSTASEWWMEFEIDDGSGANKKIRYFFTLETPIWYQGALYQPEFGYLHDQYWDYVPNVWVLKDRNNNNLDGIRWVNIDSDSDFTSDEIWDGIDHSGTTTSEIRSSQWTEFDRNILADYNSLFNQAAESIVVEKVTHTGHFMAGEAFILVDDFVFFDVESTQKDYSLKVDLTDGQHNIHLYFAASSSGEVDLDITRTIGDIWQDQNGDYCYLTGSILPQSGFDLNGSTGDSWVTIGGDIIAAATNLASVLPTLNFSSLFYKDKVEINSWTSNTYIDNVSIYGGQFSNPAGDYYFNDTTQIALKVVVNDSITRDHFAIRELGDDYKIGDYDYLTFDFLVETTDIPTKPVGNTYIELYSDGSATGYRAYLTPDSIDLTTNEYYVGGNVTSQKLWYGIGISLFNFQNYAGETPPTNLTFDALRINFKENGTYWIDNFTLNGLKGTLVWDTFADVFYHPAYANSTLSTLSSAYVDDFGWTDYASSSSTIELSLTYPTLLSESPIIVDLQEQTRLLAIMRGNNDSTTSLTLYTYSEDGTKLSGTGSSITIDFSGTNKLLGWDTPIDQLIDLSSISSDARFLACPEITTTSDWVLDYLIPLIANDPIPNIQNIEENTALDSIFAIAQPFHENFENSNLNGWVLTQGTEASFTIDDGVISVDGGSINDAVVTPEYQLLTDNFEITFKTRVTSDNYTGWVIGNGENNYRCWLDINDPTLPKVDVVEEGTYTGDLIRNIELTTDIAINEWMVFKIRRDGSHFQMWINGQQVMDVQNDTYIAPYEFGFSVWNTATAEFADLSIEPITGYNLLSQSEEIITSELISELPIAYWDLTTKYLDPNDDPTDGEVYWFYDTSGNGTQYNSKSVNVTYNEEEGCYAFDGTDDVIIIPMEELRNSSGITITGWHQISDDFVNNGAPFSLMTDTGTSDADGFWWHIGTSNNNILVRVEDSGGEHDYTISSITTPTDQWISDIWVVETDSLKWYRNGQLLWSQSTTFDWSSLNNDTLEIRIGQGYYSGYYYRGLIGSLSVFDHALTPEEIVTLYQPDLSLIEPDGAVTIDSPINTENWVLSGLFNLMNGVEGDLFTLTIGGEELVVTAENLYELLSFNVSSESGSSSGTEFSDGFDTWNTPDPWSYGHIAGGTGNWTIASTNNQLRITTTSKPSGGTSGERYGAWQDNLYLEGDFDISVEIGRHDTANTWYYHHMLRLEDTEGNDIAYAKIFDGWAYSTAYWEYFEALDYDGAYNAAYDWHSSTYQYNYNFTAAYRIQRVDGVLNLYRDATAPYGDDWGSPLVTRSDAAANRTVKAVYLESQAGGTYWASSYCHFDNFHMDASTSGSSESSSLNDPLLYTGESSLLLSLPLTDEEGSVVQDLSIYSNNGSLTGATLTRSTGVEIDSKSDSIILDDAIDSNTITVSLWYYFNGTGGSWNTLLCRDGGTYHHLLINNTTHEIGFYNSGWYSSGFTLSTGQWYHLTLVKDGTTSKLYVDGDLIQDSNTSFSNASYPLKIIGNYMVSGTQGSLGYIRNVQVWDDILLEEEIEGLANTFGLRDGNYGSAIPFTIRPLNDAENRIGITIGAETLYLENLGLNNILENITITDPSGQGLEISALSLADTSSFFVNSNGAACNTSVHQIGVNEYESSFGSVSGELDDSNDELGIEIADIVHTTGKHMILSIDINVSVNKPVEVPNPTQKAILYLKLIDSTTQATHTYNWYIRDHNKFFAPAYMIINGAWTTLQVNTHESGINTDTLQIFIKGDPGESSLTLGRINIIETTDLESTNTDDLLPYGISSSINSVGHSIYMDDGSFVLKDNQQGDNDCSSIDIPMYSAPITKHTRVSFDWYLGLTNYMYSYGAGIYLPVSTNSSTNLAITLADGDNVGDIGTCDILAPYINDFDNDSKPDNYNQWLHCDISLSDYVNNLATNWQDNIRIFIDGNAPAGFGRFFLKIANLQVYEQKEPLSINLGKRIGETKTSNHFIDDWIASPLYPLYDEEQRLPKTNIIINSGFENGYNATTLIPDHWTNGDWYDYGDITIAKSTESTPAHSGQYYAKLESEYYYWDSVYPELKSQTIDVNTVKCDTVLISFWYQLDMGNDGKIEVYLDDWKVTETPESDQSEWTYFQTVYSLNDLFFGFNLSLNLESSTNDDGYALIDDVRVQPAGWTGDEEAVKDLSCLRTIDPSNFSQMSLLDGWYEITNVGSSDHYLHAVDTSAGGDGDFAVENGYSHYFYTQLLIDSKTNNFDDNWTVKLEENTGQSDNVYAIWINKTLEWVGQPNTNGLITLSNLSLITGLNDILIEQLVEDKDAFDHNMFRVRVERNWTDFTLRTVRPHSSRARTPLVFNDPQFKSKWITRDGTDSALKFSASLGEGTGSKVLDQSFNNNDGTIVGGTWYNDELYFNGSSTYVDAGNDLGNPDSATMSIWMKPTDTKERTEYILDGRNYGNWWWLKSYEPYGSGNINFHNKVTTDSTSYNLNAWNHVAVTIDELGSSTIVKLYVNGELKDEWSGSFDFDLGRPRIGARFTGSSKWKGYFANCNIWDRVLTQVEINDELLGKLQIESGIIDTSQDITSSLLDTFNWSQTLAITGNSSRLQYYMDSELTMYSDYYSTSYAVTGNQDTIGYDTHQTRHWSSPYLGPMYSSKETANTYAIDYLEEHPATNIVYWTLEVNAGIPADPAYKYYEYKTERTYNFSKGGKTIWHPFGTVLMSTDVFPSNVYAGEDRSKVEQYLESGGKFLFSGGYIPFSYYSTGPDNLTAVGTTGYDYEGALGHQKVLDLDGTNNDDGNYASGMFIGNQQEDDYDEGMDVINETTPAGYAGQMKNLDFVNYEPVATSGLSPVWTQLSHTGYQSHMILTKHEYDLQGLLTDDGATAEYSIYNADGSSGEFSHDEKGDSFGEDLVPETMISPLDSQLWFKPYLTDQYGGITFDPTTRYHLEDIGTEYNYKKLVFSHHESANVGTALVQGGTNAKGIIGVMPMFEWTNICGLNINADNSSLTEGKYSDRGYGSITNSPTTEDFARKYTSLVTAQSLLEMYFDVIEVNVCRDNSTNGTNFLNFSNESYLGGDWEVTSNGSGNVTLGTNFADKGPLTVSSYSTNQDYNFLAPQSGYPIYGGSYRNMIANYDNTIWKNLMFKSTTDSPSNPIIAPPLSYVVPTPDSLNTTVNIDKEETKNAFTNDKAKVFTLNGLRVDSNNDNILETDIQTSYHGQSHQFGNSLNITTDYADQPYWGYSFGTNNTGSLPTFERDNSYLAKYPWNTYSNNLTSYSADTLAFYNSMDTEMVLRNSENLMNDNFSNASSIDRVGYYQPLALSSGATEASLSVVEAFPSVVTRFSYPDTYTIVNANDLVDGYTESGGWGPHCSDFDYFTGMYTDPGQHNRVKLSLTSEQLINDIVIFAGIRPTYQDPLPPADFYDEYNHPRSIRITLYDSSNKVVQRTIEEFAPGNQFEVPGSFDHWLPTAPLIYHLEEPIAAKFIEIEVWSLYTPIDNVRTYRYVWLSEVDAYTGSESLKVVGYTDTEAITRVPDYYNNTAVNRALSMDNGDDTEIGTKMFSNPRQASTSKVSIGVKNDLSNPKMKRWNMYYAAPVSFSSAGTSFRDGFDCIDLGQQFWQVFFGILAISFILLIIFTAVFSLNIAAAPVLGATLMLTLDILAIGFMVTEFVFSGFILGGWEGSAFYNSNILFRTYYHWLFDWDGTIVRICLMGERFDLFKMRFISSDG